MVAGSSHSADYRPDMLAESFKGVTMLHSKGILNPHIGAIFNGTELDKAHAFLEGRTSIGKVVVKWDDHH